MRKYILTKLALFTIIPAIVCAQNYWNPRSETVSLVKEGVAYFNQYGAEQAFKEFNNRYGQFVRGNLYLYVYDFNGVCQANGRNPKLAGKNLLNTKDIYGNHPVKLLIAKARTGGGWVSYYWKNSATGRNAQKLNYIKPLGHEYLIGAGYYFNRR